MEFQRVPAEHTGAIPPSPNSDLYCDGASGWLPSLLVGSPALRLLRQLNQPAPLVFLPTAEYGHRRCMFVTARLRRRRCRLMMVPDLPEFPPLHIPPVHLAGAPSACVTTYSAHLPKVGRKMQRRQHWEAECISRRRARLITVSVHRQRQDSDGGNSGLAGGHQPAGGGSAVVRARG